MKVLLVNGSPRKGNTRRLLQDIESSIGKFGHSTELISIGDFEIKDCLGCYRCVMDGKEYCPLKDDAQRLWGKFEEADGIVLGTPVYALGIPAGFKRYMDRIAYNAHRPTFYNRPTIAVATTAGMGTQSVIDQLRWFSLVGCDLVAAKGFLTYPKAIDREKSSRARQIDLDRLTCRLNQVLLKRVVKAPTLLQVIQFYAVKLNAAFAPDIYKADYEYYKDRKYHGDARIGIAKLAAARLFYQIGFRVLESKIERASSRQNDHVEACLSSRTNG
jgi:multimeric flavodoxin WrbA